MKRILRLGDCYALTKYKPKQYIIRYISLLAVLTSMCLYAVKQVSAQEAEPAATAVAENIKPLQIGDTIPEYLWQLPLQLNEHQGNYRTVRLADYRGKLILLDFWALWCSSCIKALPKLNELQAEYAADIAVLPIVQAGVKEVTEFRSRNNLTRSLSLPIVVSDTLLSSHFPHRTVSHIAWISPQGKLISTTGTDPVESKTIAHILNDGKPYWAPKIDAAVFDYAAPLFELGNGLNQTALPFYHGGITGYQPGLLQKVSAQVDSNTHTIHAAAINQSLYQLILQALGLPRTLFPVNQIHWQVHDRSRYVQPDSAYQDDWKRMHTYCYENKMPINSQSWRRRLQDDLMHYFPGMIFSADTGIYDCLVLVRSGDSERFRSTGGKKQLVVDADKPVKILQNCPVNTLVNVLNIHVQGLRVYNGTDFDGNIDIELPIIDLSDLTAVRNALMPYDLDLVPDRRQYVRIIIKDQPDTFIHHKP